MSSFTALLEFLYTGEFVTSLQDDWFELIELGDRMCLPSLVARTELCVVDELLRKQDGGCDVTEEVLDVIELAQVAYFSCCVKIYLLLSFGTPKGEGVYVAVNHCTI